MWYALALAFGGYRRGGGDSFAALLPSCIELWVLPELPIKALISDDTSFHAAPNQMPARSVPVCATLRSKFTTFCATFWIKGVPAPPVITAL